MTVRTMARRAKTQLYKSPFLFSVSRRILFTLRRFFRPVSVEGLPGRIHPNDFMANRLLPGGSNAYKDYVEHSKRHFDILCEALQRAGRSWQDLGSVLDFASGYGRVTRWLPTVLPAERIIACDIQKEAVEWCAAEYGVRPLVAKTDFSSADLEEYDLLFSISLMTHLPERGLHAFLHLLEDVVRLHGVVVFSTHGLRSAQQAGSIKEYLDARVVVPLLNERGVAFFPYPHYKHQNLGDTFVTRAYLEKEMTSRAPSFSLVSYHEARFWDMQDCYVLKRTAAG